MTRFSTKSWGRKPSVTLCGEYRTLWGGLLTCLILASFGSRAGRAAILAHEGFDYAQIGERLLGQDGGVGFASPWAPGTGINEYTLMLAEESLSLANLQTSGNRAKLSTPGGTHGLVRNLTSPIPANETKTVYLSFLIRPESGRRSPIGWGVVGFIGAGFSGTAPHAGFGGSGYEMGNFGGGGTVTSPVRSVLNETSLFVVKADLMPGRDTFTFYVNPVPGEPEPEVGSVKTDADLQGLGWLYIAGGGGTGVGFSVDEIRLGDTYADVTPTLLTLAADFDGDHDVDGDDFLAWQAAFGCNGGCTVDADGDDDTDGDDFLAWQAEFGSGIAATAQMLPVPEPGSMLLGFLGMGALFLAGRSHVADIELWIIPAKVKSRAPEKHHNHATMFGKFGVRRIAKSRWSIAVCGRLPDFKKCSKLARHSQRCRRPSSISGILRRTIFCTVSASYRALKCAAMISLLWNRSRRAMMSSRCVWPNL